MIYKLTDTMTFGKHKGKRIEQILEDDPTYIRWALNSIPNFEMLKEVRKAALQASYSYEQDLHREMDDWGALDDIY